MTICSPARKSAKRLAAWWFGWMRGESGQSLMEVALMVPVLTTILVGAVEVARLDYAGIETSNAARAGAQYGAQNHTTAADTNGMQNVATAAGADVTNLQATASSFCVCSDGTSITCSNAGTTCSARIIEYVQVNTSASITPTFQLPGLPKTYTLQGVTVERVLQ